MARWAKTAALLALLLMVAPGRNAMASTRFGASNAGDVHLSDPTGVALDRRGNIYVTEFEPGDIVELSPAGRLLARWGSNGPQKLKEPGGIALDRRGNIFVTEGFDGQINEYSPAHKLIAAFGGPESLHSLRPVGPVGIGLDSRGNIFVSQHTTGRVLMFSSQHRVLARWNTGTSPNLLAIDARDNLYLTDASAGVVTKLSPAGKKLASVGGSELGGPFGVAVDARGNMIVTDLESGGDDHIFKYDARGTLMWSVKRKGSTDFASDGPEGVAVDSRGSIYVANNPANRVEKLSSSGKLLATWK